MPFHFGHCLRKRLVKLIDVHDELKPQALVLAKEALIRGEFARGEIERVTGIPEPSIMKARFLIFWCNPGGTRKLPKS